MPSPSRLCSFNRRVSRCSASEGILGDEYCTVVVRKKVRYGNRLSHQSSKLQAKPERLITKVDRSCRPRPQYGLAVSIHNTVIKADKLFETVRRTSRRNECYVEPVPDEQFCSIAKKLDSVLRS